MNECVVSVDMTMRNDAVETRDDAIDDATGKAAKDAVVQLPEIAKNEIRDAGSVQSRKIKNKTALNDLAVCALTRAGIQ